MEAREARARELARQEELATLGRERADLLKRQSELLLMMFDELARSDDAQRRGYLLQDLLNRLFDTHEIPVVRAFTRNEGAEQIDGAFKLEGWHYIVECRWRERLADIRQLDGLLGQVNRSGKQTMGLFLSINGWSDNVPDLLKQNPEKCIFLFSPSERFSTSSKGVEAENATRNNALHRPGARFARSGRCAGVGRHDSTIRWACC